MISRIFTEQLDRLSFQSIFIQLKLIYMQFIYKKYIMKSYFEIKNSLHEQSEFQTDLPHHYIQHPLKAQFDYVSTEEHDISDWNTTSNNNDSLKSRLIPKNQKDKRSKEQANLSLPKLRNLPNKIHSIGEQLKQNMRRHLSQEDMYFQGEIKRYLQNENPKLNLVSLKFPNFYQSKFLRNRLQIQSCQSVQQMLHQIENKKNRIKMLQNLRNKQLELKVLQTPSHHFKRFNYQIDSISGRKPTKNKSNRDRLINPRNAFMKQLLKSKQPQSQIEEEFDSSQYLKSRH